MCDRCQWPRWTQEIKRVMNLPGAENIQSYLVSTVHFIEANQHVPKSMGAALVRISAPIYAKHESENSGRS